MRLCLGVHSNIHIEVKRQRRREKQRKREKEGVATRWFIREIREKERMRLGMQIETLASI